MGVDAEGTSAAARAADEEAPALAAALSRLAERRDPEAWAALFLHMGGDIASMARRLTGDAELAQDALQEALLQLRDTAGNFRFGYGPSPDAAARGWIMSVAIRTTLKLMRRRRWARRHIRPLDPLAPLAAKPIPPEAGLARAEDIEILRRELARLPEQSARAIAMHHVVGMTFEQIAEALHVPVGTAKTAVRRGLLTMRGRLERQGVAWSVVALTAGLGGMRSAPCPVAPIDHAALLTSASKATGASGFGAVAATSLAAIVVIAGLAAAPLVWSRHRAAPPPIVAAAGAAGRELHVATDGDDSGDGSRRHPWRTIQRAADLAVAGDTVHVAAGTYRSAPIRANASGTAEARIVFVSDQRWGARIVVEGGDVIWSFGGRSWITVEGFDLSSPDRSPSAANYGLHWGSHCRFIGNHVHDMPAANGVIAGHGGAGILIGDDSEAIGNLVDDIGWDLGDNGLVNGIDALGSGGVIANNIVYRTGGLGIQLKRTTGCDVANNLLFNCLHGGVTIASDGIAGMGSACRVSNNIVRDCGGFAFLEVAARGANHFRANVAFGGGTGERLTPGAGSTVDGFVVADPEMLDYRRDGGGDYRLAAGSPCIDAGSAVAAPLTDFLGAPRPRGRAVDIGPYETEPSGR